MQTAILKRVDPQGARSAALAIQAYQPEEAVLTASLFGSLDMHSACDAWRTLLVRLRTSPVRLLRLDVSGLGYVDSADLALPAVQFLLLQSDADARCAVVLQWNYRREAVLRSSSVLELVCGWVNALRLIMIDFEADLRCSLTRFPGVSAPATPGSA